MFSKSKQSDVSQFGANVKIAAFNIGFSCYPFGAKKYSLSIPCLQICVFLKPDESGTMFETERKTAGFHFNGDQIQGWMVQVENESLAAIYSVARRNLLENDDCIFTFEVFFDRRKEILIHVLRLILNQ